MLGKLKNAEKIKLGPVQNSMLDAFHEIRTIIYLLKRQNTFFVKSKVMY